VTSFADAHPVVSWEPSELWSESQGVWVTGHQ